ncbi:MAG: Gx transporter family protein [Lachnospiraceae bacterium]|nr:Gx transporter family protein [Lachnospiraceae bacterium]
MPDRNCRAIRISLLGILLAFTVITGFVERMIPLDGMMPGMRLGLANLAIVISLYTFHARDTLLLIVLKCLTTALFSGSIIALVYSLTGSLASLLVMLLLIRMKNVSIIGVSVAGAAFHNLGQILVARLIFGTWGILLYLPLLLIVGTVSGLVIGFLAKMMRPRINAYLKANHTR